MGVPREHLHHLRVEGVLIDISTGIGPEVFAWKTTDGNYSGPPPTAEQEAYYEVIQTRNTLFRVQSLKSSSGTRILPIQRRHLLLSQARSSRIQLLRLADDWRCQVSVPCRKCRCEFPEVPADPHWRICWDFGRHPALRSFIHR